MILMHYIPGDTMYYLMTTNRCKEISVNNRLDILSKAMEIYGLIAFFSVVQDDFAPQNIMISEDLQVVTLVDLGHAFVLGLPKSTSPMSNPSTRPPSPLDVVDGRSALLPWLPEEFGRSGNLERWMEERWGKSKDFERRQLRGEIL